jgi:hypothetical protein
MHTIRVAPFLCLFLAAACSSTGSSSSPPPGDGGTTTNPNDVSATFGPVAIAAGVETTQCIVVPLTNDHDALVTSLEAHLAPGSHHLIVYKTTDNPTTDPLNCSPFTGIALGLDVPIFFANKDNESFAFPNDVAVTLPAHQLVKIEAHYINATSAQIQGTGSITLHTTPDAGAAPYQEANYLFYGTKQINIPPNTTYSTGVHFQAAPAGTKFFLVSTHQHRLGTRVQAWASAQAGDMSNPIADDKDWSNPSWKSLDPAVDFNGTNGISYQCDWNNTTSQTISWGESALDEMCFVGGYYYPSKGFQLCIDAFCKVK